MRKEGLINGQEIEPDLCSISFVPNFHFKLAILKHENCHFGDFFKVRDELLGSGPQKRAADFCSPDQNT